MASTAKCPFCGAVVTSDQKFCTSCGGKNENYIEDRPQRIIRPKTIAELKEYCAERGMPLLRMRFFIGENFQEPRAFGIYQSGNIFTVYKNKADGSRSIRYSGPDEAYAVNELFSKLLDECHSRGIYPDGRPQVSRGGTNQTRTFTSGARAKKKSWFRRPVFWILLAVAVLAIAFSVINNDSNYTLKNGYYLFENTALYHYNTDSPRGYNNWHLYQDSSWEKSRMPFKTKREALKHYKGDEYKSEWNAAEIRFPDSPLKGYYACRNELYHYDYSWYCLDETAKKWVYAADKSLCYDPNGHIQNPLDYYLGKDYQPDWIGCEYPFTEGYYRYGDGLWYYSDATDTWYKYDQDWHLDSWPVNQFSSCYAGTEYKSEWGCVPNPVADGWVKGYYRFNDNTLYYTGNVWYQFNKTFSMWSSLYVGIDFPDQDVFLLHADDYYQGTSFNSAWGGDPYVQRGYYRYNNSTYYYNLGSWYIYQNKKWVSSDFPETDSIDYYEGTSTQNSWNVPDYGKTGNSSSSWDSDWDSSDYDSWDSGDTDWDSDW